MTKNSKYFIIIYNINLLCCRRIYKLRRIYFSEIRKRKIQIKRAESRKASCREFFFVSQEENDKSTLEIINFKNQVFFGREGVPSKKKLDS